MEKEFEIQGIVLLNEKLGTECFLDTFIEFVEENQWYFGGFTRYLEETNTASISGCVIVEEHIEYNYFLKCMNEFVVKNNYHFKYTTREIIDGYYIRENGTRGKHVFDE